VVLSIFLYNLMPLKHFTSAEDL